MNSIKNHWEKNNPTYWGLALLVLWVGTGFLEGLQF